MKIKGRRILAIVTMLALVAILILEGKRYAFWKQRLGSIQRVINEDDPNGLVEVRIAERISPKIVRLIFTVRSEVAVEVMPIVRQQNSSEDSILECVTLTSTSDSPSHFQLVCGIDSIAESWYWSARWNCIDHGDLISVRESPLTYDNGFNSGVGLGSGEGWLLTVKDGAIVADDRRQSILIGTSETGKSFELKITRKR